MRTTTGVSRTCPRTLESDINFRIMGNLMKKVVPTRDLRTPEISERNRSIDLMSPRLKSD